MVATTAARDIVAPISMVSVARGVNLGDELGQVAGVIDAIYLLMASRRDRRDVGIASLVIRGGGQWASGSVGIGAGVGRVRGAERERRLWKSAGAHIGP